MLLAIPVTYSYLILSLGVLAAWLVIFFLNQTTRREQFLVSLILGLLSPVGELLFIPDYWHPITVLAIHFDRSYISLEDFIFAFAFFGIAFYLAEKMSISPLPQNQNIWSRIGLVWLGTYSMLSVSLIPWMLDLNSIYATALVMGFGSLCILAYEKQTVLWRITLYGAVAFTVMMFLIYWIGFSICSNTEVILRTIWTLYGTSLGTRIVGVPLTELVWAFSFGAYFTLLFSINIPRQLSQS